MTVEVLEYFSDLFRPSGIKISRRLISEKYFRAVHQRASYGNPLHFPAGNLPRQMVHPMLHTEHLQQPLHLGLRSGFPIERQG